MTLWTLAMPATFLAATAPVRASVEIIDGSGAVHAVAGQESISRSALGQTGDLASAAQHAPSEPVPHVYSADAWLQWGFGLGSSPGWGVRGFISTSPDVGSSDYAMAENTGSWTLRIAGESHDFSMGLRGSELVSTFSLYDLTNQRYVAQLTHEFLGFADGVLLPGHDYRLDLNWRTELGWSMDSFFDVAGTVSPAPDPITGLLVLSGLPLAAQFTRRRHRPDRPARAD
jgi:hypothetical protein